MANKELSVFITKQLPQFIQDQHPIFIEFLDLYFQWLMDTKGAAWTLRNVANIRDIDRTLTEFIEYFKLEYLPYIPAKLLTDPRLLMKHINDFYKAKGSEKSFQFLFKILFNEDVEFYYPGRDLLRVSDGKWQQNFIMYLTDTTNDPALLKSRMITGQTSGATALVEEINLFQSQFSNSFTKVYLNKSSIKGTFQTNEIIVGTDETDTITIEAMVMETIKEPTVSNDSGGHAKNSTFTVEQDGTQITTGKFVSVDKDGLVLRLKLDEIVPYDSLAGGAITYISDDLLSITFSTNLSAVTNDNGSWLNTDSHLNSDKRIQDDLFWQDYSYQLKSTVPIGQYFDIVQKTLHPAGMKLFAELKSNVTTSSLVSFSTTVMASLLVLLESIYLTYPTPSALSYYSIFSEFNLIASIVLAEFYGDLTLLNFAGGNSPVNGNAFFPDILVKTFAGQLDVGVPVGGGFYSPYSLLTIS